MASRIVIVGAGLCGNLLTIMLAARGFELTVFERGTAPDAREQAGGRSINLALASRGIRALEHAAAFAEVEPLLLPMTGRIVHEPDGALRHHAYGQHRDERIWSVSRAALNRRLYELARDRFDVDYRFEHVCTGFDAETGTARFDSGAGEISVRAELTLAADGAGSVIRHSLEQSGRLTAHEDLLDHGYKELLVPARADGEFALDADGLHIWPRGGFMLIALPNLDRSFTATLFLPQQGRDSFAVLTAGQIAGFFAEHFADALPLIPSLSEEFAARPVGTLGTVHCAPWGQLSDAGTGVLLIGDAAHAIVPFHGQGMNAAFEDCAALDALVAELGTDWPALITRFETARRDHVRAIAEMALENYAEMRDTVRDPAFERRAALAFELERRFPGRFVPRYSMVMFHPEIGYAEAQRRGAVQADILDQALRISDDSSAIELAARLVDEHLRAPD
jgi:kynurenine 3-monooxygenase